MMQCKLFLKIEITIFFKNLFLMMCHDIHDQCLSIIPVSQAECSGEWWPGPQASCHGSVIGDYKPMLAEKGGMPRGVGCREGCG